MTVNGLTSFRGQNESNYSYAGIAELWTIEKQLKNYNHDLVIKLAKNFKQTDFILEYGAGIGTLATLLQSIKGIKPDCLEIDLHLQEVLMSRNLQVYATVKSLPKKYDAIYISNVLEHIEDDRAALRDIHPVLKEGGLLVIYVPAFMMLYSEFDASVGHYRRYSKKELVSALEDTGYSIVEYQYVDSVGFFVWLLLKIRSLNKTLKLQSKEDESHPSFKIYDRFIYPISKCFDYLGFKYLLGKNILIVARKID